MLVGLALGASSSFGSIVTGDLGLVGFNLESLSSVLTSGYVAHNTIAVASSCYSGDVY